MMELNLVEQFTPAFMKENEWIGAAGPRSGPESREEDPWIAAAGPRSGHESMEESIEITSIDQFTPASMELDSE